jgi:hypothetical protein
MRKHARQLTLWAVAASAGCGGGDPVSGVIRLQDTFGAALVENSPAIQDDYPRSEWRFDGDHGEKWKAGVGVDGLTVSGGQLVGGATADFPILHVERASSGSASDTLHAVEVRLRVSEGNNLQVQVGGLKSRIS